jgi:transposase
LRLDQVVREAPFTVNGESERRSLSLKPKRQVLRVCDRHNQQQQKNHLLEKKKKSQKKKKKKKKREKKKFSDTVEQSMRGPRLWLTRQVLLSAAIRTAFQKKKKKKNPVRSRTGQKMNRSSKQSPALVAE